MRRKLLTIGHSYVVSLNRRLAHEMALAGGEEWEVTAVAPRFFHGDLRPIHLERVDNERNALVDVPAHLSRHPHLFFWAPRLVRVLRQERWDIVHMWEEPYVVAGAQVAALLPGGARLVFSSFQNLAKVYPPPFRQMERFVVGRARGWIAYGETISSNLLERPGYRGLVSATIPPGVDVSIFRPDPLSRDVVRRRLGWESDSPRVVGYLGRFVPEKGLGLLMRALSQTESPWRALFVGGGPLEAELRQWASHYGDRVRILSVRHDEVPSYLNAMDLLCAPSCTTGKWKEQFGRMLVEAFACGVPVLASDSGEIPSTVADAGIILPEDDLAAWVAAIGEVLDSAKLRSDLAARGRARAELVFAWPVVARRHLDFFNSVAAAS